MSELDAIRRRIKTARRAGGWLCWSGNPLDVYVPDCGQVQEILADVERLLNVAEAAARVAKRLNTGIGDARLNDALAALEEPDA